MGKRNTEGTPVVAVLRFPEPLALSAASQDTVDGLRRLLRRALRGEVLGLALVEMMPGATYAVQTIGGANIDHTWTRGCVAALDDELGELIMEAGQAAPTHHP
jgi:hypothetical protein